MNIVICGNYGADNLGDELILESILQSIRHFRPNANITVLSANPLLTAQTYNVKSAYLFPCGLKSLLRGIFHLEFFKTLNIIKKCDRFIFGGGGLFSREKKACFIWLVQIFWTYLLGKPVYWYAQGINGAILPACIFKWLISKAKIITVRDRASFDFVKKLLPNVENLFLTADPVFMLEQKFFRGNSENESVLIVPRDIGATTQRLIKNLAQLGEWIGKKYGLPVTSIAFQSSCRKEVFAGAKTVIGARLHSVLLAILAGVPFIAVSYDPKIEEFLKEIGLSELMIKAENFEFNNASILFSKIWEQKELYREKISKIALALKKRAQENERLLQKFLV